MLNATIHYSPFSSHCRSCFKINNLKSELSGSAPSVANPPVNPCDLSRVDGPGAGGRHLSTALRRSRDTSWHLNTERGGAGSFPTPHKPNRVGDGDGQKKNKKGINNKAWFTLDS